MKLTVKTISAGVFFLLFSLALNGGYAGAEINSEGAGEEYRLEGENQPDGENFESEAMEQLIEDGEQGNFGEENYLEDQVQEENEASGEIIEQEGYEQVGPEGMEQEGAEVEGEELPAETETEPEMMEAAPME